MIQGSVPGQEDIQASLLPESDANRIATVKHYRSLIPLAQDARKPIFKLTSADGAIGAHQTAARGAYGDFETLAQEIVLQYAPVTPLLTGATQDCTVCTGPAW